MRCKVTHPNGRTEEFPIQGENFALGLAAVKHTCVCGQSRFVDGGDTVKCGCGRLLEYYEDDDEMTGYLHARD